MLDKRIRSGYKGSIYLHPVGVKDAADDTDAMYPRRYKVT